MKFTMLLRFNPCIFLLIAASLFLVQPSYAAEDRAKPGFQSNFSLTESTVILGYGKGSITEGSYEHVALIWHLGFDVRRFFPRLENYPGTLTICLEPKVNPVVNPETDVEFGISFGLKYRHPLSKKLTGYVLGTVGPHFVTVQTQDQANGFIFFNTAGAGFSFLMTEKSALSLEYRLRHISNASTKEPNGGVNSHIGAIGYSWFF